MRQEMIGFWDAVVSVGPDANNLHLDPDTTLTTHRPNQFFTGQMLNRQRQSTEAQNTSKQRHELSLQ